RDGFAHLDDFVANLEPDMWIAAGSPIPETPSEAEGSADNTHQEPSPPETHPEPSWPETHQEPSRVETNGFEETMVASGPIAIKLKARKSSKWRRVPQVSHSLDEPSHSAIKSDTLTADLALHVSPRARRFHSAARKKRACSTVCQPGTDVLVSSVYLPAGGGVAAPGPDRR